MTEPTQKLPNVNPSANGPHLTPLEPMSPAEFQRRREEFERRYAKWIAYECQLIEKYGVWSDGSRVW